MSDEERTGVFNRKNYGGYDDDDSETFQYSTSAEQKHDEKANMFVRKFIAKFDTDKFTNAYNTASNISDRVQKRLTEFKEADNYSTADRRDSVD